jgi:hypothetical protein
MPMTALLMALTIKRNPLLHDLTGGRMRVTRIATRRDHKQEASFPQAIFLFFSTPPVSFDYCAFQDYDEPPVLTGHGIPAIPWKVAAFVGSRLPRDVKARRMAFPDV